MGSQVSIFRNRLPSCAYVFKDGSIANFVGGVYTTDDPTKAAELQDLVDGMANKIDTKGNEVFTADGKNVRVRTAKHPYIYQEAGVTTIDSDQLDPLWALKQQVREQILAEMAASNPGRDMGEYAQSKLIPANSTNVPSASGVRTISMAALEQQAKQLLNPIPRTGDPEPNPNALPNSEAAPGNTVIPDNPNVLVAGVSAADAFKAMLESQAATKAALIDTALSDAEIN